MAAPLPMPHLDDRDRALLAGDDGEARQFAMQVVVRAAQAMRAPRLIDIGFVHVDACHYYGVAHLDFARYFLDRGVRFALPAWTNTIPASLIPEQERRGDGEALANARELARLYVELGCNPVWTCAPYQLPGSPGFGEHIVVGESNAVAYYNSVVGARTNRYGDFLDVCCGLTGRAPHAGLHTDEGRRASLGFDISGLPQALRETEYFCHLLGLVMGRRTGARVPAIVGLPEDTGRDSLKAIAAAGASSGAVGLFHAVGVTPEAATLDAATGGQGLGETIAVTPAMLAAAQAELSPVRSGTVSAVAVGTPHFSVSEFARLVELLGDRQVAPGVAFYVSTSRFVQALIAQKGWAERLEAAGVTVLVDTCTYFSPVVRACRGRVMTNSAKWAYYAPGMLPVEVAFGSLADCVETAVAGEVRQAEWIAA